MRGRILLLCFFPLAHFLEGMEGNRSLLQMRTAYTDFAQLAHSQMVAYEARNGDSLELYVTLAMRDAIAEDIKQREQEIQQQHYRFDEVQWERTIFLQIAHEQLRCNSILRRRFKSQKK